MSDVGHVAIRTPEKSLARPRFPYDSNMCSTPQAGAQVDVRALLAAAPGLAVMAELERIDAFALGTDERLVLVEAWEKQQAWVAAQTLTPMVAVVGAAPVDADDFVREDVRAALHLSRGAAQERIEVARLLHTTLAATRTALAKGQISYQQVRALVDAVVLLEADKTLAVESAVLGRAPGQTVGEFRAAVARALLVADPQTVEEQHAAAVADRRVVMYPGVAGMAIIVAELPAKDARTVWLALDAVARSSQVDGDLPIDARRADALTSLCADRLADPSLPRQHGRPAQIQVVTDLPTLLGLAEHPGDLIGYCAIPASVVRAMAADGCWQRLIVEPVTGHLLDAGTARYRPSQELADFILTRSRICQFPTCHAPAQGCDIDHTTPYDPDDPGGGRTSSCNCRPVCRRHHRLKTHGGWSVETHPDGSCIWINPTGRRFHAPATDHRPLAS